MAVVTVELHEATTNVSRLGWQAQAGDVVVVQNQGTPVARIVVSVLERPRRTTGMLKGTIWVAHVCCDPDPDFKTVFYEGEL